MSRDLHAERDALLTALFGEHVEPTFDEATETNMRVDVDVRSFDRIVGIGFSDPLVVAN